MSITVEGTIQHSDMGTGTWVLVTDRGDTYEICKGAPKDMLKAGLRVKAEGTVREDVMTIAMIGPVLDVNRFEVLA